MSYKNLGRETLRKLTKQVIESNSSVILVKRIGRTYTIRDKNDVDYGKQVSEPDTTFYIKVAWQSFVNTAEIKGFRLENLSESLQISDVLRIHSFEELKLGDELNIKNSVYTARKVNYWSMTDFWICYAVKKDYTDGYFG